MVVFDLETNGLLHDATRIHCVALHWCEDDRTEAYNDDENKPATLIKPNPPTKEAVERAKFVDKTYHWSGSDSVRPRNKRSFK